MMEEYVVLSERPEDQLKAVEWAREQKKKILEDKNRRIADVLMEKMTPMILKNGARKQNGYNLGTPEIQPYKQHIKPYQNDTVYKHKITTFIRKIEPEKEFE